MSTAQNISQKAEVIWSGSLKDGHGEISTGSKVLENIPYSFHTRFEGEKGTNPEELVAAAHAACFSMALSGDIGKKGFEVKSINTTATVSLDKSKDQWTVISSHLEVEADVANIDEKTFLEIAEWTQLNCPISRLLNAKIYMSAKLMSQSIPLGGPSESYSAIL